MIRGESDARASAGKWLTVGSGSKINLFLEVLGKRSDGYHELETVMLRTRLQDRLHFRLLKQPIVRLSLNPATSPQLRNVFPLDASNLIVKAAECLRRFTGTHLGADVTVLKRIPSEAGLAGGSSNAAATLQALNSLWGLNLAPNSLHQMAASLGSDVNFLLSGVRAAVCRGRGEIVEPLRLTRRLWFVAVRPGKGNNTAQVFHRIRDPGVGRSRTSCAVVNCLQGAGNLQLPDICFNRLTQAACALNPEMADLLTLLPRRLKRTAFMSGSGSTICLPAVNRADALRLTSVVRSMTRLPTWILEC